MGSIPTLVRVFLCPCVGPFPSVGLTLTWFIWDWNLALHITLYSVTFCICLVKQRLCVKWVIVDLTVTRFVLLFLPFIWTFISNCLAICLSYYEIYLLLVVFLRFFREKPKKNSHVFFDFFQMFRIQLFFVSNFTTRARGCEFHACSKRRSWRVPILWHMLCDWKNAKLWHKNKHKHKHKRKLCKPVFLGEVSSNLRVVITVYVLHLPIHSEIL